MICVIGWLARLGYVADLLSKPVLTGYMAGIAVLMIVSQLGKITGMRCVGQHRRREIGSSHPPGTIHYPTLILSAVVLLLLAARGFRHAGRGC